MKSSAKWVRVLRDACAIALGSILYAVVFNWLFQPNQIVMGGLTGVAQTLNHLFPFLTVGLTVLVMNIPLFVIGFRLQGMRLLVSSLSAMTLSSLMVDLVAQLCVFQPMENKLLACIYGGVLLGISMGMLMKVGATTGGSDLAARLLKYKLRHLSIGKLCLGIDLTVIALYAVVFKSVDSALYGIITMYISSIAMDAVVYGGMRAKMAHIISRKSEEIKDKLLEKGLGVTELDGRGGFLGGETRLLLSTFRQNQISDVKQTVTDIDPNAFIIVCEAHEVIGEGFGAYTADGL